MADLNAKGWAYPGRALKRHYIARDGRSLCLRWLYLGPATDNHECPEALADDQCQKCHERLKRRQEATKGLRPVDVAVGEGNPQEDSARALSQDVAASTG